MFQNEKKIYTIQNIVDFPQETLHKQIYRNSNVEGKKIYEYSTDFNWEETNGMFVKNYLSAY